MRLFIPVNYLILKVRLRIFLLLLPFSVARLSMAQGILNDSVKQVYGHHTTFYVTEEDILENKQQQVTDDPNFKTKDEGHSIDTNINNMQNYEYLYRAGNIYQDLGLLTTAMSPIFYQAPTQIGKSFGFNSYTPYAYDPAKIKYYNTKSPYSLLEYTQGTLGQQILRAEFSRNIKPNWNFGVDFRTMSALKTIGFHRQPAFASSNRDLQGKNFCFAAHMRYFTKDSLYQVLANLTFFDSQQYETGGVQGDLADSAFAYKLTDIRLKMARNLERRVNYHLYQQYSLADSAMQLYHIADYYNQADRFTDGYYGGFDAMVPNGQMYLTPRFDTLQTSSKVAYRLLENKVGIKGTSGNITYRAYYRLKDFSYTLSNINTNSHKTTYAENFVGGYTAIKTGYFSQFSATGEYFFAGFNNWDNLGNTKGDYLLKLDYSGKNYSLGYNSVYCSPSLMQRNFISNYDTLHWANTFKKTLTNTLYAKMDLKIGNNLKIHPSVSYTFLYNYIYFNTEGVPEQDRSDSAIQILAPEITFELTFLKKMHFDNYYRYTSIIQGHNNLNMPKNFDWAKLYYQNTHFNNALMLQLGVEIFYRSSYNTNYYMPVTQQFYLNNSYSNFSSYTVANLFVNVKIKNVIGFLKLSYLNQAPNSGYYMTPYYPGMPRAFEFGLRWMFFD